MCSFQELRQNAHLSRRACADYLRVNLSTVNRWDNDAIPAPFAVCELLRAISGDFPSVSLSHVFNGWRFGGDFIYSPEGEKFTPEDIKMLRIMNAQAADYRSTIAELKSRIASLSDAKEKESSSNVVQFSKYARS